MERLSSESAKDGNRIRKKTAPGTEFDVVDVLKREVMVGPADISIVHRSAAGMIRSKDAKRMMEKNMMTSNGIILMAMEGKRPV